MPAGDITLRLLLTGEAGTAISAVSLLGRTVMGAMSGMRNSVENVVFGFNNLQTAGTIGPDAIKQSITGMAGSFLTLGAVAGAALVGVSLALGVTAVKAAGAFEVQITKLYTTAGEAKGNLGMISAGILDMSTKVGTGAKELADAMYLVESANFHGAAALQVFKIGAMGAKAENAELTPVLDALTSALNAYGLGANAAASTMNTLVAATGQGKMTLQQLASSLSNVLPASARFKISLTDVTAAIATMTAQGDPASQAATHLRQMILALEAPSKNGAKALASVGLSSQQVADEMKKSLPAAIQMITDAVGKKFPVGSAAYNDAIKNIAGGTKQMMGFLELSGPHLQVFQSNVNAVSNAVKSGGNSIMGWSDVQQNFNFKIDQAKAAVGTFLIQLGTQLFPVFSKLMTVLFPIIKGFMDWIVSSGIIRTVLQTLVNVITFLVNVGTTLVKFFQQNALAMGILKGVLIVLAFVITTIIVAALYLWTAAAISAGIANIIAFWPVYLIILIIIVVIALVVLAIQHWGQIVGWLQGVWSAIAGFFVNLWNGILIGLRIIGAFFVSIWSAIVAFVVGVWNGIVGVARTVWGAIAGFFGTIWGAVSKVFMTAWNSIVSFFTIVWNVIKMVAFVLFAVIVAIIIAPFVPLINWFKAHWTQIHAVLVAMWNIIAAAATTVWNAITGAITTAVTTVRGWIMAAWTFISGWLSVIWGAISTVATTVWNAVSGAIMTQVNNVKQMITTAWTAISGWLSIAWGAISVAASTVWNTISTNIMRVVNPLKDALGKAWDSVKTGFSNVMNSLSGIATSAWNNVAGAIKSSINFLIGLIDTMIRNINSTTSTVGIPPIPTIPMLAAGGTNLPGGPYWVGEAGRELLWLPQGSTVMSHGQSESMVSGGSFSLAGRGGSSQPLVIQAAPIYLDKRQVGEILFTYQQSELRKQGVIRNR